ncbi:MAG TPA: hypothetical protein VJS44_07680 [Pyrinomonadaceae bacterium]|nr:hypothetical protein [Pyrinomonadaceae bacterium]
MKEEEVGTKEPHETPPQDLGSLKVKTNVKAGAGGDQPPPSSSPAQEPIIITGGG